MRRKDQGLPDCCLEIFILPNNTSPWTDIGTATELSPDSASKKSLEHAGKWLKHCLNNHKQCNRPTSHHHLLPTRLVDVLSSQHRGPVRLIETSSGQKGRYLCLSHCWGDPSRHPLKTTSKNLERHKEKIPWNSLPKTFQDAISFVRSLGESYIWIDSLCIVQDWPDDWNQEASKMADVFSNSYLTLAATKSTNSTESLFSKLDDKHKPYPYKVKGNWRTHTLYFRKPLDHLPIDLADAFQRAPLLLRAWVYQELVLSPRTLHFGDQELLWDCKEVATCQCGLEDRTGRQMSDPLSDKLDSPPKSTLWREVVSRYSNLKLTKESDRLPAIAGVAKQFQRVQGREGYLAGLWKESLLEDLLWIKEPYTMPDEPARRDTSVAPSWSW
ncbi:heterokaryon incompatibility protein-domain-containing protein, partial [Phyllosticta capitalensis]